MRSTRSSQVIFLKTRELDVLGEVSSISKCLFGCQEAQALVREIGSWKRATVVSVLHDNSDTICCLCKLGQDTLLEEWNAT